MAKDQTIHRNRGTHNDWRCKRCRRLLGVYQGDRVHIRFGRGHEYLVARPVTATCRGCGTLSEIT